MVKYLSLLTLSFLVSGCLSSQPVAEYRIESLQKVNQIKNTQCSDKSLKIYQAFSENSLRSLDMQYGVGEYQRFRFSLSKWSKSPNKTVTDEVYKYFKNLKIFKSVQTSKSHLRSKYILEINIDDLCSILLKMKKNRM